MRFRNATGRVDASTSRARSEYGGRGEADAMLCGAIGQYHRHLRHLVDILGLVPGASAPAALSALIMQKGIYFLCDTYVVDEPAAEQVVEMTLRAADAVRHFGSADTPSARKMRQALALLRQRAPALEVEGEMHADAALSEEIRQRIFPHALLKGPANLLIMPNLDAANIALNTVKVLGDAQSVGPILLGINGAAHVVTPSITVRGLLNMTAIAVYDAQVTAAAAKG